MLDIEPVILGELARLAGDAPPAPDWTDVLDRTGARPGRRHRLLLVATAVTVALATVAVAVAATFGGFRSWLTGEPGKPASPSAQLAFERATRSWQGFPRSTQLRQLVTADVDGIHYELDGFRGAGSLCLRLVTRGAVGSTRSACAPLAALRVAKEPALVLAADFGIGTSGTSVTQGPLTFSRPLAAFTFGVIADDVQRIQVTHRHPTPTEVFVSGDAFLAISPRLSPFNTTTKIVASAGHAGASVPFVQSGTPFSPPAPVVLPDPSGPTIVERKVTGGAIGWFARREPRGTAVPANLHHLVGTSKHTIFARVITPEPGQPERMVVSISPAGSRYFNGRLRNNRQVCAELVGGRYQGGDCWPAGRLFTTAPFTFSLVWQRGEQVEVVAGLAADSVTSLKMFPALGPPRDVTIHDNGYFLAATLEDLPLRLVAYDKNGQIVGNKTLNGSLPTAPMPPVATPAPGATWKKVLVNDSGSVYAIRSTSGGLCVAFKVDGGTAMGCDRPVAPEGLSVSVGSDRSHGWIEGLAGEQIRRLRLTLRNGQVIVLAPIHRYVLYRLPHSTLRDRSSGVKRIDAFDAQGRLIVVEHYG